MRKVFVPMVVGIVLLMVPVMAIGASVVGSVQGFNCVTQGKLCPIGQEDPIIAAENVFVLLVDAAKGEYYFVPNLDRAVLARHVNKEVKIDGDVNMKMKSVYATDLYDRDAKGNWIKTWSRDKLDEIYHEVYGKPTQGQ